MKPAVFALSLLALTIAPLAFAEGKIEPPVAVRTVPPEFPYELRRSGVSGIVLVDCLIDQQGDVQDMKVKKSSNDAFVQPAMNALRKWRFKPAQRDGSAVAVRVCIPIRFTVQDD